MYFAWMLMKFYILVIKLYPHFIEQAIVELRRPSHTYQLFLSVCIKFVLDKIVLRYSNLFRKRNLNHTMDLFWNIVLFPI